MLSYKSPLSLAPVTVINSSTGEVVKSPSPVASVKVGSGESFWSSPLLWVVAGVLLLVSLER